MGTTPIFGWPWPNLTPNPADGPDAFAALATAVEATLVDPTMHGYIPTWVGATTQPVNPATNVGWWRQQGAWCDIAVSITFGASTVGGGGQLTVGLPFVSAANPGQQLLTCKTTVDWVDYWGVAVVFAGTQVCAPRFPLTSSTSVLGKWQSCRGDGALGSGIPASPGQWSVQNGMNFSVCGRYLVA